MSHEYNRKVFYSRDRERERERDRDREWNRNDYHYEKRRSPSRKRSRSPPARENKRRSRSPRKHDKIVLDDNILSEISKLPEPSELWDNQVQEGGFTAPPASTFPQDGSNYGGNYNQSYSGMYNEFPSVVPTAPHPQEVASWNQMSLPPPPAAPVYNVEEQIKKEAAIETEMRHQKAALSKQREDYIKKAAILKKELDTLKDQRNELRGDAKRSPSPDTKRFLKENTKLQLEIQNKLKTINNVVDMLNGIIGEEAQEVIESDDSTDRNAKRKSSRSPSGKKFNYVYYDPEMHWCRVCNEFPATAKDYLNHLHSPAHHKMAAAHMEAPWHSVAGAHEGFPSYASAPTKRTPIRGLQFFVPSTAWYCKLCDQFIGDLHCASAHLKSVAHSKNYTNFVEQNPHWETDWMSDRQKAFEKTRANNKNKQIEDKPQYAAHTITFNKDGFHTKLKMDSPPPPSEEKKKKKDKKKKNKRKRSSSSSSSSSSSGSDSEPKKKKKSKKNKTKYSSNDKLSEWMSSIQVDRLNDNDRKLLDNIKTRIKLDKMETTRRSSERERSSASQQRAREQERRESRAREERDRREEPRRRDERRDDRRDERREERRDERREERRDERRDDRRDEHREERRDEHREERRDERREERRDERRDERDSGRRSPQRQDAKKPEIRKMPFIGKMPVYKNLAKTTNKPEEKKEDDSKKKEEDEASKKRREEMDAEIQKKVAEFKQKIATAQLERQQAELAPPLLLPALAAPHMQHAFMPPAQPPPPATTAPPANLPKDFQDALDIIFPSEVKNAEMAQAQQELFQGLTPGMAPPGFPGIPGLGGVMQPFPQLSILGNPPHMMMGFDMNTPLFQPRPQLYDTHVPILPNQKPRQNQNKNRQQKNNENRKQNQNTNNVTSASETTPTTTTTESTVDSAKANQAPAPSTKNKEELDDLAMLGIDASDVGAGI